ncbi:sulfurtransferase TusA family protein [Photobacterium sp. GB-72]|uniref:sulfurtransferase TusA family protein n=1 Tax=Photobacterium sp. GB-72 TaxID=2022105 RepID=UPI0013049A12|nr:sulfurtransferase TusA family protein [Photobacterium sp. GB-72]
MKFAIIKANKQEWTSEAFEAMDGQPCIITGKSEKGLYTYLKPSEEALAKSPFHVGLSLESSHFEEQEAHYLDVKNERCPDNVSMAMAKLRRLKKGEYLLVDASDNNTLRDFPKFCDALNYRLHAVHSVPSQHTFLIEK